MLPFVFSQASSSDNQPVEQSEMTASMSKQSSRLAAAQERLSQIYKEISSIIASYREKKISSAEAEKQLRPLLKEQMSITSDPDYIIEFQLFNFLYQKTETGSELKTREFLP